MLLVRRFIERVVASDPSIILVVLNGQGGMLGRREVTRTSASRSQIRIALSWKSLCSQTVNVSLFRTVLISAHTRLDVHPHRNASQRFGLSFVSS
jgi:hypothetical protein